MPKQKAKVFSSHPGSFMKEPDLVSIQTESFNWFKEKGLKVEFASFPGAHEWQVWRKSLHDYAQRLFK